MYVLRFKKIILLDRKCWFLSLILVCATGTILFANKGCIKIETSAKNRADAETQCNSISQGARLLTIKNSYEQEEIEKILQQNGITDDIHLGASKDGTQWLWSDGSPVFVTCMFKKPCPFVIY